MPSWLGIAALVALILANGWFVAAEFAYVAVRRGPLEDAADGGSRRAQRAVVVLRRLSFMLSGAQLGITVSSLVVGLIAQPTLGAALTPVARAAGLPTEVAQGVALLVTLVVVNAAQMVFGELAPKNLAIARPEQLSLSLARGVGLYLRLAGPVISLFDGAANRLLRMIGITPAEELAGQVSVDELSIIIQASGREGLLSDAQQGLLSRALEFAALRAVDAMLPRTQVTWLPADASVDELREVAVSTGRSRFPVCGEDLDDILGVVQAKDVLRILPTRRSATPVRELLHAPLVVPEQTPLNRVLTGLRTSHTALAVVVDEHGGTAGIVTLEDIVEELVGSIQDEYDPAEPTVQALPGGGFLVPGSYRLDEVERETGIKLPDGEWETVGGLVMATLGRIPTTGDVTALDAATLRVEAMQGFAVARVRVMGGVDPDTGSATP